MRKVLFLDFSDTLFHGCITWEYASYLKTKGILSDNCYLKFQKIINGYLTKKTDYEKTVALVQNYFVQFLKGQYISKHKELIDTFLEENKNLFYPFSFTLIEYFKERGFLSILVTAEPAFLIKKAAKFLNIDYSISTKFEIRNGIFTGKMLKLLDKKEDKLKAIKKFISDKNVNLKNSWAFGDADADLEMLKLVAHPVAFNPKEGLKEYAKKNKWLICNKKNILKKIRLSFTGL